MRRFALLVCCVAMVVTMSASVGAGTNPSTPTTSVPPVPATWSQITDASLRNIDEVGVARTGDGLLHVVWRRRVAALKEEIVHTAVKSTGDAGTSTIASGGWPSAGNPDIVVLPNGGLRVLFAGLTGSNNNLDGAQSASAGADGSVWTPQGTRVSSTTSAIPEGVGAATLPDGTPVFGYAYSFVLGFHVGLDPAIPDSDLLEGTKCCAYFPDVVVTPNGTGTLGFYSNVDNENGIFVQQVLPSVNPRQLVPGSVGTDGKGLALDQRMPMVARGKTNEVWLAYCGGYPTCTQVLLWQVGTPRPVTLATGRDIEAVNLASDPSGRLWITWEEATDGSLHAIRTSSDGTRFGGSADFAPPPGTSILWKMQGNATDSALDVFATATNGSTIAAWHATIQPGLDVESVRKGKKVTFTVTDAATPLPGVKIKLGKKTVTTDKKGRAVATGKGAASLTKTGYWPKTVVVE